MPDSKSTRFPTRNHVSVRFMLLLTTAAVLALTGCGSGGEKATSTPTRTPTPAATNTPSHTPTPEASPTPSPTPLPPPPVQISEKTDFGRGQLMAAALSPDGKTFLAGGYDGIHVYNADDMTAEPQHVPVENDAVTFLVYSADGSRFVSTQKSGSIMIWDAAAFEPLTVIENAFPDYAAFPAISDDLTMVAASRYNPPFTAQAPVLVYDISGDEPVLKFNLTPPHMPTDMLFTADGSTLVVGDAMTNITMWDLTSGEILRQVTIDEDPFQGNIDMTFNADESILYVAENKNGVFAFDPTTLELVEPFAIENETSHNGILLLPDESRIFTCKTAGILVYDTQARALLPDETWDITKSFATISRIGLSDDGTRLMTAIKGDNELGIWDVATREQTGAVNNDYVDQVTFIDVHPDGDKVFVTHKGSDGKIWDISGDEPVLMQTVKTSVDGHFILDGNSILARDAQMKTNLIDITTGEMTELGLSGSADALAMSPDGATVISSEYRMLTWLDVATKEKTNEVGGPKYNLVEYSPDGRVLVALNTEAVGLFDAASGEELLTAEMDNVRHHVDFTADSSQAVVAAGTKTDARINFYDTTTGEVVREIEPGGDVYTFALSPDDSLLVAAVKINFDRYLRVWDMETGEQIQNQDITDMAIFTAMDFTPDGSTLVVGDAVGRTHLVPVMAE